MHAIELLYLVLAAHYAGYCLGLIHARGHRHWKNTVAAVIAGALFPLFAVWGVFVEDREDGSQ